MSASNYQSFIKELLALETLEQVSILCEQHEHLLTKELLQALNQQAPSEHLSGLIQQVTYLFGRKSLFTYIDLTYDDAIVYASANLTNLASQANFYELEHMIDYYADQSEILELLRNRQSLLAAIVANEYLFTSEWPQQRELLLIGLDWLLHPAAISRLDYITELHPEYLSVVEKYKALFDHCRQENVVLVVKELDIDWLLKQAEENKEEALIQYYLQAPDLTGETVSHKRARIWFNLGNAYLDRMGGGRADNLEEAIKAFQNALQFINKEVMPYDWAITQNNLGNAYSGRIRGERADNLEEAIKAYQNALLIRTKEAMPYEWSATQINLGNAYLDRIGGERADNLEEAIKAFQNALQFINKEIMPYEWAIVHYNLGNIYLDRIGGERADNLEEAIKAFQNALQFINKEVMPYDWAITQNNLGNAYQTRIRGEQADNLEEAIKAYQNALLIRTKEAMPYEWVRTQYNLGNAYLNRIRGERADNLEAAIQTFQDALLIQTKEALPHEWARTQNSLGNAYLGRIQGERADNLEEAIKAYQNVLQFITKEIMPYEWAITQNNLGNAYSGRIRGERADNLEAAIEAFQNALLIQTKEALPHDWAITQNNLGNAYQTRIRGEQADNLEEAIKAYQNALLIRTKEAMPYDWATTQNNLGNAYRTRIRGERADNLEAAIEAFQNALLIQTKEALPHEWARTQNNLGNAYQTRIRGERADNLEEAIKAYQNALLIRTKEAMPYDWAGTQNNLGSTYQTRIQGERADNLEEAIKAYQNTLLIQTKEAMPYEWARTQYNLGNAYQDRIRGEWADNLEEAIKAYQNALLIQTKEALPKQCLETSSNLGNLYYQEKQWEEALHAYELAHAALESMRGETLKEESRKLLAQDHALLYTRLIHCCLLLDELEAAATYALQGKSRTLTEQLAGDRQTISELVAQDETLTQDYQALTSLQGQLDELLALLLLPPAPNDLRSSEAVYQEQALKFEQINTLRKQINTLVDDLVFTHPTLSLLQPLPPLTPADVKSLSVALGHIPLVEYVQHAQGWGAFVITADQLEYVPLADDLFNHISESLDLFLQESPNGRTLFWVQPNWRERLAQLHDLVFKPLLPFLPPSGQLVIAPTKALYLVPFQALCDHQGKYVSETYAISFVPSLTTLAVLDEQRKQAQLIPSSTKQLLNIAHSGTAENHLVHVALEAQEVSRQFDQAHLLAEEDATRERVIAAANKQAYQVIHFNCHGSFLPDNPAHSGLLLAQNRLLTVNDIRINLRLQGRPLVTLSACQTGQTLPEQGDETVGISWAFLTAGASAVLASQWSVPDRSTRALFNHFYQIRRQSQISDAQALQLAIRHVRQQFAAFTDRPEYWAGFQLMGLPHN